MDNNALKEARAVIPEKYAEICDEYTAKREHSMHELLLFLSTLYMQAEDETDENKEKISRYMSVILKFFRDGESGGMDAPGHNETESYIARYETGLWQIIDTLDSLLSVAAGSQHSNELRDFGQIWTYLGWNIEDHMKVIS